MTFSFLILADKSKKKKKAANFTENYFKLMESGGEQGEKNIQEFFNDVFVMMLKDSAIIAEGFLKIQKQKFTEEEYLFLMKDIMDNQVGLSKKF